jgi:glycosyltransferase involved in cell wall biosynthesis
MIGPALLDTCRPVEPRRVAPKRAKVVHVVVAGEVGGAERMLVDLAAHPELSGADHVIALMTPNPRLSRLLEASGLDVRDRGVVRENVASFLWRSLGPSDAAWLTDVLRSERADIVHLHTFGSQVIGTRAALRAGARVLRTEHSSRVYTDASCWPFSRWSLGRADRVVAISHHIQSVVLSRAPFARERLVLVSNGVDTSRFAPRHGLARDGQARHGFAFALVGRLERRKGVDLALEALARLGSHSAEATLDVVGHGYQRAALERQAAALGIASRVRFHGHVDDTRDVLARADAALCSSREEGLGIALLEAMAMQRPVVAFAVGGVPEFVKDEETGWLARARTSEALAARMQDAMADADRRRALGRAARAAVVASYSMQAMCDGYREAYASLMARVEGVEASCPAGL